MAKRFYGTTDETRKVLLGNEAAIAKAKGCDPSYVYNIKNSEEPDPYPPFREWFQFCAIGGAPVREYLRDLDGIATHAEQGNAINLCVKTELSGSLKEDNDLITAHVNGKSLYDQLKECDESLNQKRRLRSAILEAINTEKNQFNAGKTRINGNGSREILTPEIKAEARRRKG